jgi:hypothetical protein
MRALKILIRCISGTRARVIPFGREGLISEASGVRLYVR